MFGVSPVFAEAGRVACRVISTRGLITCSISVGSANRVYRPEKGHTRCIIDPCLLKTNDLKPWRFCDMNASLGRKVFYSLI